MAVSSVTTSWNLDEAERAYCAYGADLIRTGGALVRTTPSVVYRAAVLFQRFQASITRNFRSCYLSPADESRPDEVPPSAKHEYVVPEHAGTEFLPSGLVPLIDLRAPLDFCIHHLVEHEDISYVCAACLVIAAKMEDPDVRIRPVVDAFQRLGNRRCGIVVNELLKPPPERYDDFKSCVVKAEEMVLQELGFQTFVEVPYKYVLVYLSLLVGEEGDTLDGASPGKGVPGRAHSAEYIAWLSSAVKWLNDVPRCRDLVTKSAADLAVCALQHTCSPDVLKQLPGDWTAALGVPSARMAEMDAVYAAYLGSVTTSAKDELEAIRAAMPRPTYLKSSQKLVAAAEREKVAEQGTKQEPPPQAARDGGTHPHGTTQAPAARAPPQSDTHAKSSAKTSGAEKGEDEDDAIDLLALRKKRRREEKERERKERRHKDKARRHHRSRSAERDD